MKNNKKIKIITFIFILFSIMFISIYHIINNTNIKQEEKCKNCKYLKVIYSVVSNNDTIHNVDSFVPDINEISVQKLTKKGNKYEAYINNVNHNLYSNITDYAFAINNTDGIEVFDATFNKSTMKVSIPEKYFKNKNNVPLKFQLVSKMPKEKINNTKVNITVNRIFNNKKTINVNGFDTYTEFSIHKYGKSKSIKKSDLLIYVNSNFKLNKNMYSYNQKTGVVTLKISPLLLNKVDVKINKLSIFSLFSINEVDALKAQATLDDVSSNITSIPIGTIFTVPGMHVDYVGENYTSYNQWKSECSSGKTKSCEKVDAYEDYGKSSYILGTNGAIIGGPFDFLVRLKGDSATTVKVDGKDVKFSITFEDYYTYIALACSHTITGLTPATDNNTTVTLKVVEVTSNSITFDITINTYATTQTGYGRVKFNFKPNGGALKIKKVDLSDKTKIIGGIKFKLYSDDKCTTLADIDGKTSQLTSQKTGYAKFSGLAANTKYWVQEVSNNIYEPTESCKAVVSSSSGSEYAEYEVTNKRKKYALLIDKVDTEHNSDNDRVKVSGATFSVYYGQSKDKDTLYYERTKLTYKENDPVPNATGTTDGNGQTIICGLPDKINYIIKETANSNGSYWNNDEQENRTHLVTSDSLVEYTDSCPGVSSFTKSTVDDNLRKYYCTAVKKVDATNTSTTLAGANFSVTNGSVQYNSAGVAGGDTLDNGLAYFFLGDNPNGQVVTENKAPVGWAPAEGNKSVAAYEMPYGTLANGSNKNGTSFVANCQAVVTNKELLYKDNTLVINWYKDTENGKKASGAQFKVKGSSGYIHVSGMVDTTDASGIKKRCYQYAANGSDTMVSDANGEVCVKGIPQGTYTVEETMPAEYHTFSNSSSINVNTGVNFAPYNSSNTFINLPTYFEFSKSVNDGDNEDIKIVVNGVEKSLHDLTTEELSRIDFNVYFGNTLLSFVETTENGKMIYSFGGNTIDLPAGNVVTDLHLDSDRLIRISHLPKGTYTIKEKNNKVCDNNSNNNDCIGYYYPDYKQASDYTFTITACSNDSANSTACSNLGLSKGKATQKLTNKRTEIMFTKKDFYKYYDQKDIVDFENDKERSDFDRIKFKIKDASGRYLTVKKVKDVGTQTGDNSYSEYRYVSTDDSSDSGGTVMYARGGNIKITNLCRGNTYTIEEIEVPEDSVFVKENTSSTPTSVSYNIPCNELATGTDTKGSTTNIIEDKPTRIRLEKRDSKYNYLIPDETTTFKLYRCKKGEECHPGDYSSDEERESAGMKLIKFYARARIPNDEEDPKDAEGLAGVEVYKMMSDSDIAAGTKTVVDLHPYKGILVLRYLQANYNYVLLETVAPKNYQLPVGRNAETSFKPVNDTVDVDQVDVPNKPTSLLIKKYDSKGNLLPGAEFKIYDAGTSCDPNISAADQKKTELKLKTIRDGIYENRENKDTDTIKTCRDRDDEKCSDINPNAITKLTYETNLGNWSDFADEFTKTEDGKKIEIQEGTALIQYLEYGHCYVIEETKAPDGHSLPAKDKDRFTMVTIKENDEYAHSTYYKFINKPTPFQFYKYDEFNKLLDGAEFKLQKLDDNKKYHDVTVSLDDDLKNLDTIDDKDAEKLNKKINELKAQAESGVPFYKVDTTTDNTIITTKNGTAVVYYLSPGQYRIVETKAAPGKELTKNPNIATFFVDSNGNVFGNSIIVNKSKTEKIQVKNSASAELIVNVQTGQTVIKYGLIISIIAALITGLMILRKKMK